MDLSIPELKALQAILGDEIDRANHEPNYDPADRAALNSICDKVDSALAGPIVAAEGSAADLPTIITELLAVEAEAMESGAAVDYADVVHQFANLRPQLKAAWADQTQLGSVIKHFAQVQAAQSPALATYIAGATQNDELEVEDFVSEGADEGAWALSWQWVTDADAGIDHCEECNAVLTDSSPLPLPGPIPLRLCPDCSKES